MLSFAMPLCLIAQRCVKIAFFILGVKPEKALCFRWVFWLIVCDSQVVEKELLIQEKEKLYMELKQILARQPGPEVAEQLSIYQQTLKEKTKQMKGMSSELNMYEAQVKEYKYEIERLAKELQEVKKKFYMQKRKEQQAR